MEFCLHICSQVSRKTFKYVSDVLLKIVWWLGYHKAVVHDENNNNDLEHLLGFYYCLGTVTGASHVLSHIIMIQFCKLVILTPFCIRGKQDIKISRHCSRSQRLQVLLRFKSILFFFKPHVESLN